MEARGSLLSTAVKAAGLLPDVIAEPLTDTMGVDRLAALHTAIKSVRRGGTVSVSGVYGGQVDPLGLTSLATHRLPLEVAPGAYDRFQKKQDGCMKVVLKP